MPEVMGRPIGASLFPSASAITKEFQKDATPQGDHCSINFD